MRPLGNGFEIIMTSVSSLSLPMTRDRLPAGEFLCGYCTGKCCRYYAFAITKPATWQDYDYIRWFLMHGKAAIFVDGDDWYIQVFADCQHLLSDNRCGIYETRPQVCRSYTTDECEYDVDSGHDMLFESADQIEEYAEAVLPPKKRLPWSRFCADRHSLPVLA